MTTITTDPFLLFLLFMSSLALCMGVVVSIIFYRHSIAVAVLSAVDCPCYADARAISRCIYEKPGEWSGDTHWLRHPKIGAIWTGNSYEHLHIDTPFGKWTPTPVERRIIRNAVDWRLREYIKARIGNVLDQGLLR